MMEELLCAEGCVFGSMNTEKWISEKFSKLNRTGNERAGRGERQALLLQAETLLLTDAAIVPLYFSCVPYALSGKISGMTRTGFQEYDFCDGAKIAS